MLTDQTPLSEATVHELRMADAGLELNLFICCQGCSHCIPIEYILCLHLSLLSKGSHGLLQKSVLLDSR